MDTDFVELTEVAGSDVSAEQVARIARRYAWAASHCAGKDVLEAACGTGQGIGLLKGVAGTLSAGDFSATILDMARRHYGERQEFLQFDAQRLPFADRAFDVVILFEALYYLPEPDRFFAECRRVLRPGGCLLLSNANKDLFDFTPSAHSHAYHGVVELERELQRHGFATVECFGDTPVDEASPIQRALRPLKALASRLGLMPKSMSAKKLLKRLVFGRLVRMPPEISAGQAGQVAPQRLAQRKEDRAHKVLFCRAIAPG